MIPYEATPYKGFLPYWANTSDNGLIREIMTTSTGDVKSQLEQLIRGDSIRAQLQENLAFDTLEGNADDIWNLLLFSGYLKVVSTEQQNIRRYVQLQIPNAEITYVFEEIVLSWFAKTSYASEYNEMLRALTAGDIPVFERMFQEIVKTSFNMFDPAGKAAERVYHAFVLGILIGLQEEYDVRSNRESGYGRYDIMLIPKNRTQKGIIIEFKKIWPDETFAPALAAALQQIEDKDYASELRAAGCTDILKLAIVFQGKKCRCNLFYKKCDPPCLLLV
jgi:hypothetical protein